MGKQSMKRIYLDNAATSFPKAPGVGDSIKQYLEEGVINSNRTESNLSFSLFETLYSLREKIAHIYSYPHPETICFTKNATEAINCIIKGLLSPQDHCILSSNEHNAVMRPIVQSNISYSLINSDEKGFNDYSNLSSIVRKNTKATFISLSGNVSGAVQELEEISEFCTKHSILLFIDAAQGSPFVPISMEELNISGICFTCHKGFLGPEGVGGYILKKDLALKINPLISGGTGSQSDSIFVPTTLPDRLSAGTENIPGLIGVNHALNYLLSNFDTLRKNEMDMTHRLIDGILSLDKYRLVGAGINDKRTSVVSITSSFIDNATLSSLLLERGNIETRVGLHCAVMAHKSLKTFPSGTLRFSTGPFTTKDEIDTTLTLLKEIRDEKRIL